jgi:ubiquitin-protein ligase
MSTVRLRRLQTDHERLRDLTRRHPRIRLVQTSGEPPDRYQLSLNVRSLRMRGDAIEPTTEHLVEIALPFGYPRMPPHCRMLTPVFHPNIAPHAICIGDHWSPGETLGSIVVRIAEMLAFQSYNTKSPLNGEAARWVEENLARLPLDPASMTLDDVLPDAQSTAPAPRVAALAPPASAMEFLCTSCGSRLRVAASTVGRVRCPRCRAINEVKGAAR